MPSPPEIRADILARLLLIQETLEVLPDNASIAAFLRRSLGEVPGVKDSLLCVGGTVFPPSAAFQEMAAQGEAAWRATGSCPDRTIDGQRAIFLPLRTALKLYGMLVLVLDDEAAFEPYRAFVRNVNNVVATTFETREHVRQLDEARAALETLVDERTATLRESQEKFRALVETTSDWVWEVDAHGTYTYASPKVEALLGYDPSEVVGRTPFDLMPPEEAQRVAATFLSAMQAAAPLEQVLNTNRHRDGHAVIMETSGTPVLDERGVVVGYRGVDRDVTARWRAEDALRESENKFRQVSACAQDAIVILNQDGLVTDWNAAAERMFGYRAKDVIGRDLHALLARSSDYESFWQALPRFREDGAGPVVNRLLELTARRRDGSEFPVELSIAAMQLSSAWHAIGIVRDISERKQSERALRHSEASLKAAQRIARAGNWELDLAANTLTWTDEIFRIFELDAREFGASYDAFLLAIHPDDRETVDRAFRASTEGRTPYAIEHRLLMKDGRVKYVQERGETEYDAEGHPVRSIGTVQDITERKLVEEALGKLASELKEAQRLAQIGSWDWDATSGDLTWSQEYFRIHGIAPSRRPPELEEHLASYTPESAARLGAAVRRTLRTGEPYELELELATTGTPRRWVTARSEAKRDDAGRISGLRGTAQDITERKHLQSQLLQAQKLESVGRLAGGVAHDFNNMLTAILGYADLTALVVVDNPEVAQNIEEIRKAAQRSANLTRQLLAFARKESIAPRVMGLNDAVEGILKMLQRVIGEYVTLVWTPGHEPWNVKADPAQMDQVLANLAVNARDAMLAGEAMHGRSARLEIGTANVRLDAEFVASHPGGAPGEYVRLRVSDNGCGMDASTLAHVFEPFFTTKALGQGTGLGMATVYGIVKQHSGLIDIQSAPGEGTTVDLYLPRALEAATEEAATDAVRAIRGDGETILLVDDEESVRTPIAQMLHYLGYQVLTAAGAADAIALVDAHQGTPDLLLTDVIMAGMNGLQLRDELLKRRPGLRALFMSGYAGDMISAVGLLDEGTNLVRKPITLQLLQEAVRRSLDAPARLAGDLASATADR
ncbi:MAG: PAS domain S-box protein [Gemmatimonadaceae bacterium]